MHWVVPSSPVGTPEQVSLGNPGEIQGKAGDQSSVPHTQPELIVRSSLACQGPSEIRSGFGCEPLAAPQMDRTSLGAREKAWTVVPTLSFAPGYCLLMGCLCHEATTQETHYPERRWPLRSTR